LLNRTTFFGLGYAIPRFTNNLKKLLSCETVRAFYLNTFLPEGTTVPTFADDTAIIAVGSNVVDATQKLKKISRRNKHLDPTMTN